MYFRFVLVRPRNPVNIGSAARAMANFGFSDLAVVAPYEPTWREAVSAVGAESLLKKARVFKTLDEAVADCRLILATTAGRLRAMEQPLTALQEMPAILAASGSGGPDAILFGSEKTGLPKKILDRANYLVTIPTDPACPTLNLAQSVAVCAYELSRTSWTPRQSGETDEPLGFRQRQQLIAQCISLFDRVGYLEHLPPAQKSKMLWRMFNQWNLRRKHAGLIQGLIRKIQSRFGN